MNRRSTYAELNGIQVAHEKHRRFWTELGNVFDAISNEPSIRAVVLASALPKLFCAGIDRRSILRSVNY